MKTDALFYRLFQEHPATAFELAGKPLPEGCRYRLHAEELKQTAQRLDGVLLPDCDRPDVPLVFTEAQFYGDRSFYGRWLSAIFLYLYRHEVTRPWWAVVVFPDRATDVGIIAPFEGLIRSGWLYRVYLEDLTEEEVPEAAADLRFGRHLARLVVLERGRTPREARALVEATAGLGAAERDRIVDLIETILVYKLTDLSREEVQKMLHLPETDLKKTRFYQEVFSEGREEGWEEGQKEGRVEGRKQEALNLVLRQLQRRVGAATLAREDRLRALSLEQLEELGEALLDFQSPDELDAWLESQARGAD